jgi:hypothetical protein
MEFPGRTLLLLEGGGQARSPDRYRFVPYSKIGSTGVPRGLPDSFPASTGSFSRHEG